MARRGIEFAVNLRGETLADAFTAALRPDLYLAAPGNLTSSLESAATGLRAAGIGLVADNGNFELIERAASSLRPAVGPTLARVRAEEKRVGAQPVRLTNGLGADLRARAREARKLARTLTGPGDAQLDDQLALEPSGVIGVEDITAAVWLALDLEPEYTGVGRRELRRYNESVARRAVARLKELPRDVRAGYLPVASALSYDTAYDAGRAFGQAGLRRASMGFGAFMADDDYVNQVTVHGRARRLPALLPARYVRTALAARGFWDGYRDATGRAPLRFHFLGLGAPIMLGVVALAARGTPLLTFDATSPIKDAAEGTLYVSKPAFLKVRTRRFAERLAAGEIAAWGCPCTFCRSFTSQHPFDLGAVRSAWSPDRKARAADLRPGGALNDAMPLLSEPRAGPLRKAVTFARIGHNHWAIAQIAAALEGHRSRGRALARYVESVVEAYERSTNSSRYAQAVRLAYQLAVDGVGRLTDKETP